MSHAALIYPHQLFQDSPALAGARRVFLIEEPLFFRQYRFHRQKLMLHRATMRRYADQLRRDGRGVDYIESRDCPDTSSIVRHLQARKVRSVAYVDPCDDWLATRLADALARHDISAQIHTDPDFLTSRSTIDQFAGSKAKLFFTEFYIEQRKRLNVLLDPGQKPVGGKWSFDPENRRRLPREIEIPSAAEPPAEDEFAREARQYVRQTFPDALGDDLPLRYPTSREEASRWLDDFLTQRLANFGAYEDAISSRHPVVFHSVLTPMLNVGLVSPRQIVEATLKHAAQVPLNSLEGFLRQVIGWREFVRLVYLTRGRRQRCRNFWDLRKPLPPAFYEATTGIPPVDHVIRQLLRTGYCHHIERLMILGNFLLLCDVRPDDVYQWFMELFVDAYDWVMVPNVYGMSQHADGGLMTTKPYISGSAYVLKMSDFPKGDWCAVWDALYWRFVDRHAAFFASNPRTAVMVKMRDKLGPRLARHLQTADQFLERGLRLEA